MIQIRKTIPNASFSSTLPHDFINRVPNKKKNQPQEKHIDVHRTAIGQIAARTREIRSSD